MLGDLIANLDQPEVAAAVPTTMDPIVATRIERRAAAAATVPADFAKAKGAVRAQMLPGLAVAPMDRRHRILSKLAMG
jgi:hypothetical protein